MDFDLALQFELGDAPQVLAQDSFLISSWWSIAGVLVMTSAAAAKMWTGRRGLGAMTARRSLRRARERSRLFFGYRSFDFLPAVKQKG